MTLSWCCILAQPSLDTPHPRLLPANTAPSLIVSLIFQNILSELSNNIFHSTHLMAAVMLATQSAASPGDSARNTHDDFWSGENISKHRAASSPVTHCLERRQKCKGMLRESALGEAGGARLESRRKNILRFSIKYFPSWIPGIKNVSKASQPILDNSVAFRKYGVTSFKYFT